MQERQQISPAVLIIATYKYKMFVQPLIDSIKEFFLLNHKVKVFLFTDDLSEYVGDYRVEVEQISIPPMKYPEITLYRYHFFSKHMIDLSKMSHLYYLDADMRIVSEVTDEILVTGIMAVRHPGFYINNGWGDSNNPILSRSYLPKEKRKHYYCGGTQGGDAISYLNASVVISNAVGYDEVMGIRAEWNDETFFNHYCHTSNVPITEFSPSYCMPEPKNLREAWGLTELKPIILALDKNHSEIRS